MLIDKKTDDGLTDRETTGNRQNICTLWGGGERANEQKRHCVVTNNPLVIEVPGC